MKQKLPNPTIGPVANQEHAASRATEVAQAQAQLGKALNLAPMSHPSVRITADGIEYTDPLIRCPQIWTGSHHVETLTPKRAVVAHGVIVIEELGLTIPVAGTTIRTEKA